MAIDVKTYAQLAARVYDKKQKENKMALKKCIGVMTMLRGFLPVCTVRQTASRWWFRLPAPMPAPFQAACLMV